MAYRYGDRYQMNLMPQSIQGKKGTDLFIAFPEGEWELMRKSL